jgi:hypothetical protein
MTETQTEKEIAFWIGHDRCEAKEDKPPIRSCLPPLPKRCVPWPLVETGKKVDEWA